MMRIFIYYSLTGNGDLVAKYYEANNADIRKVIVKDKVPKSFFGKIFLFGFLAGINHKSKLVNFDNNIRDYDEVIIGSPIWNDRLSCPINTVLDNILLNDRKLTFVFYSGSGTSSKAEKKVKKLYPNAKIINLKEPLKNENYIDVLKNN